MLEYHLNVQEVEEFNITIKEINVLFMDIVNLMEK